MHALKYNQSSVIVDDQTPDGNFNLNESALEAAKIIMFLINCLTVLMEEH
jgi:hypothetical protein